MENNEVIDQRHEEMIGLESRRPGNMLIQSVFIIFVFVIIGILTYSIISPKESKEVEEQPKQKLAQDPGKIDISLPEPKIEIPEELPKEDNEIIIPDAAPVRPDTVKLGDIPDLPNLPTVDPAYQRKLSQGVVLSSTAQQQTNANSQPNIKNSVAKVQAGLLNNQDYLIVQGTKIHCTLETALSSGIPGYVSCITARDVYSMNGNVILLDRGTKITGKYESSLKHGQARLMVVWNRAVSPNGVTIELASGGTGALGRSGHSGQINSHWWKRFGNALLVSVIGDSLGYLSDKTNNENFENTERTVNDLATIAAESGIEIKPTIDINQGENIIIYAQRDLDFSSVYQLQYR